MTHARHASNRRIGMKENPSIPLQFMSLLEDAGVVNIAHRNSTFEQGMFGASIPFIPDRVVDLIILASLAFCAIKIGLI